MSTENKPNAILTRLVKMVLPLLAIVIAVVLLSAASPVDAAGGGVTLRATMIGANEVPGPGSAFGSGEARVILGHNQVCFTIRVRHLTLPATGAHIHAGPAGVAGPIVVPLTPPDANGFSHGCVNHVDGHLIAAIVANPGNYYANVHTTDFKAGAIRGQLSR